MARFEPGSSGDGGNHSANCGTTAALILMHFATRLQHKMFYTTSPPRTGKLKSHLQPIFDLDIFFDIFGPTKFWTDFDHNRGR